MLAHGVFISALLFALISAVKWPPSAAAFFFLMIAFDHLSAAHLPQLGQYPIAVNAYFALLVVAATIAAQSRRRGGIEASTPQLLAIALVFYALASSVWSPYEDVWQLWLTRAPYLFLGILLLPLLMRDVDDFHVFVKSFLWASLPLCILLAFSVEWFNRAIVIPGTIRSFDLRDPLNIAMAAGAAGVLAILYWKRSEPVGLALRVLVVLISAYLVVLKTESRGQFLAMVVVCFATLPVAAGRLNFKRLAIIAMWLALIGAVSFYFLGQLVDQGARWQGARASEDWHGRISMASVMVNAWLSSPQSILFGLGNSAAYSPELLGIYPHIVPIEVLTEEGVIGFSIYLALLVSSCASAVRLCRAEKGIGHFEIRSALTGLAAFYALLSFKQGSLIGSYFLLASMMLLARGDQLLRMKDSAMRHQSIGGRTANAPTATVEPRRKLYTNLLR